MMTVTLAQLRTRALRKADMENSAFISTAEANDLINEAYCSLYDLMVQSYERYFAKTTTISLVAGTSSYTLPSDFYKAISLDKQSGQSYVPLEPYQEGERDNFGTTAQSIPTCTVRMRYVPCATLFSLDSDTADFVNGWEALLVTDVAIMMLEKEESATDALERRRDRDARRLLEMAQNRDVGSPARVEDVYKNNFLWIQDSLRYRLYGNTIEFVSVQFLGV